MVVPIIIENSKPRAATHNYTAPFITRRILHDGCTIHKQDAPAWRTIFVQDIYFFYFGASAYKKAPVNILKALYINTFFSMA